MGIDIRTIANGETVLFAEELALNVPKAYGALEANPLAVSARGRVVRHGDDYTVQADCAAAFTLECGRCLRPVRQEVSFALAEMFSESPSETDDNADVWPIYDKTIDLTQAVESGLYSLIPSKVVCGEDCAGDWAVEE